MTTILTAGGSATPIFYESYLVDWERYFFTDVKPGLRQRQDQGLSSDREHLRALSVLEGVRAVIPALRATMDAELNRLDVLMGAQAGTYRTELLTVTDIPVAPPIIGAALSADLLRRRPDIAAAEQQLKAANARVGQALSQYYPQVTLGASVGVASTSTTSLYDHNALQEQGLIGLRWRLFDFGRIDAEVAMARGKEAEALAEYRETVLQATAEIETSLSRCQHHAEEVVILQRQLEALRHSREQTQLAFQSGAVGLIDLLDADREVLAVSNRLVTAEAEAARSSVAAFRAFGGGWQG